MTREEILSRQQELLDNARAAGRELTAEEQNEWDSLQRKLEALDTDSTPEQVQPETGTRAAGLDAEAIRAAERSRIREIEGICGHFGIDSASYVNSGMSVENVRQAVLTKLMENGAPIASRGTLEVTVDEADKFRAAATDGLLMRGGVELSEVREGAREYRGMSLRDLYISCEGRRGKNVNSLLSKSTDELYNESLRQYFNPESDFAAILDNTVNKAYAEGHKTVQVTFDQFCRKGSLSDFKASKHRYLAGTAGAFLEVPENGEIKADTFADTLLPVRKLKTYARQFTLTRQAFIDDDIGMITRKPAQYAASARKTQNKQVFDILVNNPAIFDGVQLFHNTHKNVLGTGTGITQAALQKMLMALQTQTDQNGDTIIVRPAFLIVPIGLAMDVYTILHSSTINTSGNTQAVNPLHAYADFIKVIEDPTLNVLCGGFGNTMPWFLVAAKEDTELIQVDYLNGQEVPNIRRMEAPGTLGYIWDMYLDWGITVLDFRGAVKNPGTTVANPLS